MESEVTEIVESVAAAEVSLCSLLCVIGYRWHSILSIRMSCELGKVKNHQQYFTDAVANGVAYVSDVFFEPEGPSLYFTSPVWDDSGKIVGVLRVQYNAVILHNMVMNVATKWEVPELYAVLIDDQYSIRLSHSRDYGLMYKSYAHWMRQTIAQLQSRRRLPSGTAKSFLPTNRVSSAWLKKSRRTTILYNDCSRSGWR